MTAGGLWNLAIYGKVWGKGFSRTDFWVIDSSFSKGSGTFRFRVILGVFWCRGRGEFWFWKVLRAVTLKCETVLHREILEGPP